MRFHEFIKESENPNSDDEKINDKNSERMAKRAERMAKRAERMAAERRQEEEYEKLRLIRASHGTPNIEDIVRLFRKIYQTLGQITQNSYDLSYWEEGEGKSRYVSSEPYPNNKSGIRKLVNQLRRDIKTDSNLAKEMLSSLRKYDNLKFLETIMNEYFGRYQAKELLRDMRLPEDCFIKYSDGVIFDPSELDLESHYGVIDKGWNYPNKGLLSDNEYDDGSVDNDFSLIFQKSAKSLHEDKA